MNKDKIARAMALQANSQLNDIVSISKFPRINNETNDNARVFRLLSYVNANNKKCIDLQSENLSLIQTLNLPDNVSCIGNNATVSITSVNPVISVGSNSIVRGVSFVNNYSSGCIVINIKPNATNIIIKECKTSGRYGQGVLFNNSGINNVEIKDCLFDNLTYGILLNPDSANNYNIRILNNSFTNIYGDAIELNPCVKTMGYNRNPYETCKDIIIANNYLTASLGTVSSSGFGIGIAGANKVTIENNVIASCRKQAIHVEDYARNIVIVGNMIDTTIDSTGTNTSDGINIAGNSYYVDIIGNTVIGCTKNGINIDYDETHDCKYINIADNTVMNNAINGICVAGRSYVGISVTNNSVYGNQTGIKLLGDDYYGIICKGNTIKDNTQYGIYVSNVYSIQLRHNNVFNNVVDVYASKNGIISDTIFKYFNAQTVTADYTNTLQFCPIPSYMDGKLKIVAKNVSTYAVAIYDLKNLNGTKTITLVYKKLSGAIDISSVAINGSNVEGKIYLSGQTSVENIKVFFEGYYTID